MKKLNYNDIDEPIELLEFMHKYIKNGFISKNNEIYNEQNYEIWPKNWQEQYILQDYIEVLNYGSATCWDQVELERQWFENHHYKYQTYFMWFDLLKELPTHAFLIYEKENKYYWFENSFTPYKGIYEANTLEDMLKYVIKIFIKYTQKEYNITSKDYKYLEIFKYYKPKSHISAKDFIKNATKNKINIQNILL